MKEQILKALKIKFTSLGFGEKAFEGVADYLATTVTEEDKIETAISGVEGLLKSFQGDIDKRVNDAVSKAKKEKSTNKGDSSNDDSNKDKPSDNPKDEVPAWAKSQIEQIKALTEKIQGIESGKTAESRRSVLEKKLENLNPKLKDKFIKDFGRMNFSTDEDFQTYLTETETEISEIKQDMSNQNLKTFGKPLNGGLDPKKEISAEQAKSIVSDMMKN